MKVPDNTGILIRVVEGNEGEGEMNKDKLYEGCLEIRENDK